MAGVPLSHFKVFAHAAAGAHAEAAKELITVTGISAIPFGIGAFAYILPNDTGSHYLLRVGVYLASVFLQGQLFLISVSFLATSLHRLWNSDHSYERPDFINGFAILLFAIIGLYYGINPSFAQLRSHLSSAVSLLFFIVSLVFYYYTAVLAYDRPKSIEQSLTNAAEDLHSKLSRRRAASAGKGA